MQYPIEFVINSTNSTTQKLNENYQIEYQQYQYQAQHFQPYLQQQQTSNSLNSSSIQSQVAYDQNQNKPTFITMSNKQDEFKEDPSTAVHRIVKQMPILTNTNFPEWKEAIKIQQLRGVQDWQFRGVKMGLNLVP